MSISDLFVISAFALFAFQLPDSKGFSDQSLSVVGIGIGVNFSQLHLLNIQY